MAVVSISRIQQRRGRKNSSTGFPQLASGEIGWAIDTQELYIGNGSVSEGAPFIGNTKILTEHENIFDFADTYTYEKNNSTIQTGADTSNPVERTLQERLDEFVTVKSFGAVGDGATDDTAAFQRALDQLYLNTASKELYQSRIVLHVPPGEYLISDTLKVPPFARMIGSGIESTVIHLTNTGTASLLRTVDGASSPGTYTPFESMAYLERPRYFQISGMTLLTQSTNAIVMLDNADYGVFSQVLFRGTYSNGTSPVDTLNVKQAGVWIRGTSNVFRTENVIFDKCFWNKLGFAIYSDTDHSGVVVFDNKFLQLFDAISIGGGIDGAVNTKVTHSIFDLVDRYGLHVKLGSGNVSANNQYLNVGNNNNGYANPIYTNIRFDTQGNQSSNDYFERSKRLKDQSNFGLVAFKPVVETADKFTDQTGFRVGLNETLSIPTESFRLPFYDKSTFNVDYVIEKTTLGEGVRTGKLTLTVDPTTNEVAIKDEFSYTGDATLENIDFSAVMTDFDGDSIRETLIIRVFNPVGNGIGTINYTYQTFTK